MSFQLAATLKNELKRRCTSIVVESSVLVFLTHKWSDMGTSKKRRSDASRRITLVRFNSGAATYAQVYHWAPLDPRNTLELAESLFEFIVEIGAASSNAQALFQSPTILASRYVVWTALRQSPSSPTRFRGVGIVAEDCQLSADAILDVNCGQLGALLAFPDIRCMVRDEAGDFQSLHLQPFRTYRSFLSEEETTI